MTEHTPGPWRVLRYPKESHRGFEFEVTAATITIASRVQGRANADLIAVAPDMFKVLQKVQNFKVRCYKDAGGEELLDALIDQFKVLQQAAKAAIVKAEHE